MPFQSEKQRRYLWANEPEIARDWADTYGSRIQKNDGGISQLVKSGLGRPGYNGQGDKGTYGKTGQSFGDQERYTSVDVKGPPNIHGGTTTTLGPITPKDHFEQSWSGQPGIFGIGGGYRDLKTPGVTPEYGGAYKSRFNPMGIIGGLGGLLMGIPGLGLGINALSSLGKHKTLADWWGGRSNWSTNQTPNYEDMSQYNKLGITGIDPALLDNYSNMKISDTSFRPTTSVDEIDMSTVDEMGNTYRNSPFSTQMTEETFNEVFGNEGQEPG